MTAEQQQKLDSFYALDNVITIKITMPPADEQTHMYPKTPRKRNI